MQPTKQSLITIKEKDCKECQGFILDKSKYKGHANCQNCHGKGKFPTKLIFDAEDLGKKLPKKGEVMCYSERYGWLICSDYGKGCDRKKFRLSSDAVLKSAQDFDIQVMDEFTEEQENVWRNYVVDSNLLESSKILIVEGYYE